MTWAEIIALGALACNIILTGLALWRACQVYKIVRPKKD